MKRFIFLSFICAGLLVVGIATLNIVINLATKSYIHDDSTTAPVAQVALIPGAGVLADGSLSSILTDRVDTAINVYKTGKVSKILVSGDNSTVEYNEVSPIRTYLIARGVPTNDIVLDYAGFDTYSTMYRARDIFSVSSILIVTQSFHLPRAVFIARSLGIEAYGVNADRGHVLARNYIREIFANVKAMMDLIVNRTPKFLGDKISIEGNDVVEPVVDDRIHISAPLPDQVIQSPLTIVGEARGTWFFEASFPIVLTDWDGLIVGQAIAQAKSDWMTEDFVPFEATLTFTIDSSSYSNKGTLIFKKDNPSGLPEYDDAVEIPILFESVKKTEDTGVLPFDSGVEGVVLRGPICPVVQNPSQPECDDQPFETTVQVIEQNSLSDTPYASTKTNNKGEYSFALPPGDYTLHVENKTPFPRCTSEDISIQPNVMQEVTIMCDTGIR